MVGEKQRQDLSGKVAFVTGAGRGIGKAVSVALAKAGVSLSILSQSDTIFKVADVIRCVGNGKVQTFQADVSNAQTIQAAVRKTNDLYGRIDILVNAAAILGPHGDFVNNDSVSWMRTLAINVGGILHSMQAVLPIMIRQGSGSIINFSGGGAANPSPGFSAYGCSKAAVVRLTETVACEVKDKGIRVNVIAPGANDTDMLKEFMAAGGQVRTFVTIDKPVDLVLFLSSDLSQHITGKFLHVHDTYTGLTLEALSGDLFTLRRVEL